MVELTKDLTNIIFFIVVTIVTILSYFQARKTLFAPIRTETFKLQLKVFEEILLFFQNKSESDFLRVFDFDRIVSLNALQMADTYAARFFEDEIKFDKDARKERFKPLIGAIVPKEYAEKYFEKADAETPVLKTSSQNKKVNNPAIILANWQKYTHGIIGYTKAYQDQIKELERLSASPLVPNALREKIGLFQKLAHDNIMLIGKTITECSQLMPQHFPVAFDMKEFSTQWIGNEFNDRREPFEPLAKEILQYINDYLKVENLMM